MAKAPPYLQLSMKYYRSLGYFCEKTEMKVGNPKQKFLTSRDLFGIFDAIAFDPDSAEVIGVQATSHKALSAHKKKYTQQDQTDMIVAWITGYPTRRFIMLGFAKDSRGHWKPTIMEAIPSRTGFIWLIEKNQ